MAIIICQICKKDYKAKRKDRKFCDDCQWEANRRRQRKHDRTTVAKKRYQRYRKSHPEYSRIRYYSMDENKRKAQYYMSNAIRDGRLIKSKTCQKCGMKRVRIEGHHYKGYDPENWLTVIWLDVPCHKEIHQGGGA